MLSWPAGIGKAGRQAGNVQGSGKRDRCLVVLEITRLPPTLSPTIADLLLKVLALLLGGAVSEWPGNACSRVSRGAAEHPLIQQALCSKYVSSKAASRRHPSTHKCSPTTLQVRASCSAGATAWGQSCWQGAVNVAGVIQLHQRTQERAVTHMCAAHLLTTAAVHSLIKHRHQPVPRPSATRPPEVLAACGVHSSTQCQAHSANQRDQLQSSRGRTTGCSHLPSSVPCCSCPADLRFCSSAGQ
jgi:hypothetical protein